MSEALELSSFLSKVSKYETEDDELMKEIALQDWVRGITIIYTQKTKNESNILPLKTAHADKYVNPLD